MAVHKITNEAMRYRTDSDRCAACQSRAIAYCMHEPITEQITAQITAQRPAQPATAPAARATLAPVVLDEQPAPPRDTPARPAASGFTPAERAMIAKSTSEFRLALLLGEIKPDEKPVKTLADIVAATTAGL